MSQRIEDRLSELKSLPVFEPPPGLEAATLAAMANANASRGWYRLPRAAAWAALAVTGALIAAALFNSGQTIDEASGRRASAPVGLTPGGEGAPRLAEESAAEPQADIDFAELLMQSAYLEELLATLPQRRVMRASTAGTIVGLEQRIALIDATLWTGGDSAVPPEYRLTLMRDRVETMNALFNVRYAQSPAFNF